MIPRLIQPIEVTITPIDRASTLYDDNAREPVRQAAYLTPIIIDAQVEWFDSLDADFGPGGALEHMSGYLIIRAVDMTRKGYTPHRGDKITSLGEQSDQLFYIDAVERAAHWSAQKGPTLRRLPFTDRKPTQTKQGWT